MGKRLFLPDANFPAPNAATGGVAGRQTLYRAAEASSPARQQSMRLTPIGTPVRIVLGEARLGAHVINAVVHGSYLLLQCVWCWNRAGNQGVQSLTWNDGALPAGVSATHYTGAAGQVADPWLVAGFAARGVSYADTLPGMCYSVVKIPASLVATGGMPQLHAVVRGVRSPLAARAIGDVISYTRTGPKTYFDAAGVLQTAADNVWPVEYDPVSGECIGRTNWEGSTNLLTYSEMSATTGWAASNSGLLTVNSPGALPEGATACLRVEVNTGQTNAYIVKSALELTLGGAYSATFRCYFPSSIPAGKALIQAWKDTGSWVGVASLLVTERDQWVTKTLTFTADATEATHVVGVGVGGAGVTAGMQAYACRGQLEPKAFATPYIPTTSATVTRGTEKPNDTTISDWYNQSAGTFVAHYSLSVLAPAGAAQTVWNMQIADNQHRLWFGRNAAAGAQLFGGNGSDGSINFSLGTHNPALGVVQCVAAGFAVNDCAGTLNGAAVTADTANTMPTPTRLTLGAIDTSGTLGSVLNGALRRLIYYPERLTDEQLVIASASADGWQRIAARPSLVLDFEADVAWVGVAEWTDSPTLLTAAYIEDADWGMGQAVQWGSAVACANTNRELVSGQKRRRMGLAIDTDVELASMLEALRTYAGAWVLPGADGARFVPDRPAASAPALGDGSAVKIRSVEEIVKRGRNSAPTVMRVWYTDRSALPWKPAYAEARHPGVDLGTVPRRVSDVRLPGIFDHSQALREAVERLNKITLSDLTLKVGVFDEGVAIEPGDVRTLTCLGGIDAKQVRVFARSGGLGDYVLECAEYDVASYSNAVGTAPSTPDTTLPSPLAPLPPTLLVLTEELINVQGDKTSSRIKASWTPPAAFPWVKEYRINVRAGGNLVWPGTALPGEPVFRTGSVAELVTYQVDVLTVSTTGDLSIALSGTITAQGKLLAPGNVTTMTGFEAGGEVFLTIGGVSDIDQAGLEVRYGAVGVAWDAAAFVDFANAASGVGAVIRSAIVPPGDWEFLACARDSGGRYSATPKRLALSVTSDASSFLIDSHTWSNPTLTRMTAVRLLPGGPLHWISDAGDEIAYGHSDTNNATGSFNDLAATPFSAPRSGAASEWLSESWDVGLSVSGSWQVTADVSEHSGTHTITLQLSADGSAWTDYVGTSHKATARFARLKISTTGVMQIEAGPSVRIDAVPRVETHNVSCGATGATTVTLANSYAAAKYVAPPTPIGGTAKYGLIDNIVLNPAGTCSYDVRLFDASNTQVAGDCFTRFEGF